MDTEPETPQPDAAITRSRWALASRGDGKAFRELAESYWYCVYAWWRRAGLDAVKAPTATLASFSRWLSDPAAQEPETDSNRLREWIPARLRELSVSGVKLKGEAPIAIDSAWAETRYADEPEGDAEVIFQRRWALTILEFATNALKGEYAARGEDKLFEELLAFAGFEPSDDERYATAASRTGRTSGAMRKAVFDFRTRHRELLRGFVADTVKYPTDIESEITALLLACDAVGPQAATAPLPTVLQSVQPDQVLARAMNSVRMSTAGSGGWTPPTVQEAARLFQNYEVVALLGRGGMGAVYQARQTALDRLVAIKLLPLEVSVDKDFADRFRREARAMAKLNHPNIISVHDFGQTSEGHLYFVMEFVDGAMLHTLIHGPDPIQPAEALILLEQVCDALAYAHGKGIVHRDIKPANVMVEREGRVKVADFGLARLTDGASAEQWGTTMTGIVMGTPDYMSPEQKKGSHVDHRSDIYALGVMLYEVICKETPQGVFTPPSRHCGIDKRIDGIVSKALASKPDERFQSTAEMKAAIELVRPAVAKAQAKKAAPTPPVPVKPKPSPLPSASPAAKGGVSSPLKIAVFVVLLLAAAAFAVVQWRKAALNREASSMNTSKREDAGHRDLLKTGTAALNPFLEPGAIKLWDSPEKLIGTDTARWENGAMRIDGRSPFAEMKGRDGIVRARIRRNPDANAPGLAIRAKEGTYYRLNLQLNSAELLLVSTAGSKNLAEWKLPRTYGQDEWPLLELKAVGDELTGSIDGQFLGAIHDSSITMSGMVYAVAHKSGFFKDFVYVPLDPPAGTPTEEWKDARQNPAFAKGNAMLRLAKSGWVIQRQGRILLDAGPNRDGAVRLRASWTDKSDVALVARFSDTPQNYYQVHVNRSGDSVALMRFGEKSKALNGGVSNKLSKPLAMGQEYELELRVVGAHLTASLQGTVLVDTHDPDIAAGKFGIEGGTEGVEIPVSSIEYLNLDSKTPAPGGPSNTAPATKDKPPASNSKAETWEDMLGDTRNLALSGGADLTPHGLSLPPKSSVNLTQSSSNGALEMLATFDPRSVLLLRARNFDGKTTYNASLKTASLATLERVVNNERVPIADFRLSKPIAPGADFRLQVRAIADTLSVSVNGEVLGEVKDETLPTGKFGIGNYTETQVLIKELKFLPLASAAPTQRTTPAASDSNTTATTKDKPPVSSSKEAWEDLLVKPGSLELLKAERTPAGILFPLKASATVTNSPLDGAIQMTAAYDPAASLKLLARAQGPGQYSAVVSSAGSVRLQRSEVSTSTTLRDFKLSKPLALSQEYQLELRAVGSTLMVKLDGAILGEIQDSTFSTGKFGVANYTQKAASLKGLKFLPLSSASMAPFTSPSTALSPVDLLALVDPVRDGVRGTWRKTAEGLSNLKLEAGAANYASTIEFPYQPPAEYDFEVEFTRTRGTIIQLLTDGQRAFAHSIGDDVLRSTKAGFETLDGKEIYSQKEAVADIPTPEAGSRHTVLVEVRRNLLRSILDGKEITKWTGDMARLDVPQNYRLRGNVRIGLGTWKGEVTFHKAVLRSVNSGQSPPTPSDSLSPKSTPATPPTAASVPAASATKDAPFVNPLGMKFVPVPIKGGPTNGQRVLFSIWDTRVQDYQAFVKDTKREWPKADYPQDSTHPAVNVSWEDAQLFCQWLSDRDHTANRLPMDLKYRLPSDHEWSCAAGIGEREDAPKLPFEKNGKITDAFPWGRQWPPPPGAGNYAGEELQTPLAEGRFRYLKALIPGYKDGFVNTSPVGTFAANTFGLFDVGGNAKQWCEDWFDKEQKARVFRGSSWGNASQAGMQLSYRGSDDPTIRNHDYSFRCVLAPASAPTPATATKDQPFMNTLGMKFVPVPITGGPTAAQRVLFSIWDTRVQDYQAFVKDTKREWPKPEFEQGPSHPAVNVSWEDAKSFCKWLTERDQKDGRLLAKWNYRLPSDHEWSCAVGIGDKEDAAKLPAEKSGKLGDVYPWGTPWPPPVGSGNYAGEELRPALATGKYNNIKHVIAGYNDGFVNTSPVGSFAANRFGLFDIGGNVWQWCEDWFDKDRKDCVLRGASWDTDDHGSLQSAGRYHFTPGLRYIRNGFRCVVSEATK